MKLKFYLKNLLVATSFFLVLTSAIMSASGPGGGYSNAPGESNCTSCHGGSVITSNNANLNNILLNANLHGNGYLPDSSYDFTLSFKQTGKAKFGFQVVALDGNNNQIGTLNAIGSRNSKVTANVSGKQRQYIQHTFTGTSPVATDSTNWTFNWVAPNSNVGPIKFYVVVMAANNNSSNDAGDIIYSKTFNINVSNLFPKATASAASSNACTNELIQFTGTGTNNTTVYNWKFVGGSPSVSTDQNPIVSFSSAGARYGILTVTNNIGSSSPDTFDIQVIQSPPAQILNGSSATICKGDSILLSATNQSILSYTWQHSNQTSRQVYLKDSITTRVITKSSVTGCSSTSLPFRLFWSAIPQLSISKNVVEDSFCGHYNFSLTPIGTHIDSVYWYKNGVLFKITDSSNLIVSGNSNAIFSAVAKSDNNCNSLVSNLINVYVLPKIYPNAISFSKTTSTIQMKWKKTIGISKIEYALNQSTFASTIGDTSISLSGLMPNTVYAITLRSFIGGPCQFLDTTINIKTNACSNIQYVIDYSNRICKGEPIVLKISDLFNSVYSVSYNGSAFSKDTLFQFIPLMSDTLRVAIIDSLSPTCPPILEDLHYTVDLPIDTSSASTASNPSICGNSYLLKVKSGYSTYDFYKNNVLVLSTTDTAFQFTNLLDGDELSVVGTSNSCNKTYGPAKMSVHSVPNPEFTFERNWKIFTFTADEPGLQSYVWSVNSNVIGNGETINQDMSAFNNSSVMVKLNVSGTGNCFDSSSQVVQVPNLTSLNAISEFGIHIYPNPFNDVIHFETFDLVQDIKIVNSIGQIVYSNNNINNDFDIETKEWQSGVYHLIISSKDGQIIKSSFVKS